MIEVSGWDEIFRAAPISLIILTIQAATVWAVVYVQKKEKEK